MRRILTIVLLVLVALTIIFITASAGELFVKTVRVVRDGLQDMNLESTPYFNQVPAAPPTIVINRVVECSSPFNKYVVDVFYNQSGAQQVRVGCALLLPTPAPTEKPMDIEPRQTAQPCGDDVQTPFANYWTSCPPTEAPKP